MSVGGEDLKLKHYLLIAALVGMFALGQWNGHYLEREAQKALIDPNAEVLLKKVTFGQQNINPNDALLWSAFLRQAKTCYNCNALQEFNSRLYYTSLPVVFQVRGDEIGDTSNVSYTMVLGITSYDTENSGPQTLPRIIYYVGHRSGSLARIDELGNVQYRVGPDEWKYTWDSNENNKLVMRVRHAFQQKWQNELAAPRMQ